MWLVSLISLVLLVSTHLFAGRLRFLSGTPRSHWLSLAGGISVGYVFMQLLPELSESQEVLQERAGPSLAYLEHHAYLVALVGLVVFYGLDRLARASRQRQRQQGAGDHTHPEAFWPHILSFAVYNALIGYLLLHREQDSPRSLLTFAVALALHFVVNDYGLREDHKHQYDRVGRWLVSAAIVLGWLVGVRVELPETTVAVLLSFLSGGILINVFKEELPSERESRFWPFLLGGLLYSALLLLA
ncbi:hypothetical protein [Deinococcus peraridilitoris]|uniref:Divalent heavy-metal cations transporter n=1 Tax=Deinococcus peraridilitoris (strain DSM 19664 / LMG 22246 / CIP 109416 / KR-200) TaxID=937777 RepID=L0A4N4_DEIPD|nr:hypothetical protein [Deinococcus peraridilitoris]AFZ67985.1 hypothetical protein Deipe_2519 [Deinococcus peraridilitoris DSM 19664]